jgi:hypothetical protein
MRNTIPLLLAATVVTSSQAWSGELQSVYVAPGGIYIASGHIYVAPGARNIEPPYLAPGPTYGGPGYVAPGPTYGGPGYVAPDPTYWAPRYVPPGPVYGVPGYVAQVPAYGDYSLAGPPGPHYAGPPIGQDAAYLSAYGAQVLPRPPAAVPYGRRCASSLGYGRRLHCD